MVTACIDAGSFFGMLIEHAVQTTTGQLFLTLLMVYILLIALAYGLNIPIEFTAVIVLPFTIVLMTCVPQFLAIGGALLIYLALLLVKNLGFR